MTNKEKKAWLLRFRDAMRDIDCWEREMEEWRLRAEKITRTISDMPRGGKVLNIDDIISEMDEILRSIHRKIKESNLIKLEIEIAIESIDDPILEDLMKYRYVKGMSFKEISIILGYSEPHCWKLHGKALERIKVDRQ